MNPVPAGRADDARGMRLPGTPPAFLPVERAAGYFLRHLGLLALCAVFLGVVILGSAFVSWRDVWPTPHAEWLDFRLVLLFGLTLGIGFATTWRRAAKAFPVFLGYVFLVGLAFAFEDSILNWIVFGGGIATVGGRINIVQMTGMAAGLATAFLARQNALAYDAERDLRERGVPEEELRGLDLRFMAAARAPALVSVAAIAALAVLAQLVEWTFGDARLGISKLDLVVGAMLVAGLAYFTYRAFAEPKTEHDP